MSLQEYQGAVLTSPDSKIDLLDSADVVTKKIRKAESVPKVSEGNGILAFVEFVLLPAAKLKGRPGITVERTRDGLEPLVYTEIGTMRTDYEKDIVSGRVKFEERS